MPFLSIVHLAELRCATCGERLAEEGARSCIVGDEGLPAFFDPDDPPAEMSVELHCTNGHPTVLLVPNEIAAEEVQLTPDSAPIGRDAVFCSVTTESGKPL